MEKKVLSQTKKRVAKKEKINLIYIFYIYFNQFTLRLILRKYFYSNI
jgi:hypothetical protein